MLTISTSSSDGALSAPSLSALNPSITFESLTFSDGTVVEFEPTDVVLFVGPNNAGKSAALREIEQRIGQPIDGTVIKGAKLRRIGSIEEVRRLIESHARFTKDTPYFQYFGGGWSLPSQNLEHFWNVDSGSLRPLFCRRIATESRIIESNAQPAIDTLNQEPSHPIHMLYGNSGLERRLGGYFKQAFGIGLFLHRQAGSTLPLYVGDQPELQEGEDLYTPSYLRRIISTTVPLQTQGDGMRSFASIILGLLAPDTPSLLLLDEPEAFLHPPQARLLGEFIAKERPTRSQLFVATHSPDVLQGMLAAAPDNLRIIRIQRDGAVNRVRELDKTHAKQLSVDPVMRFTSVLSGVFHKRVIICESDPDCMFYSSILNVPGVHDSQYPDVLFVQAGGKHRMYMLAEALRALDVTVDVIADIDVLNDDAVLKKLVGALGGDWDEISKEALPVKKEIEQQKLWLDSSEIVREIQGILAAAPKSGVFPESKCEEIKAILGKVSPWKAIKRSGENAIPRGDAFAHFRKLQELCHSIGLWIVPAGELEGFCKSEGKKGPTWVQNVLEKFDPCSAKELDDARSFIRQVWSRISS